MILNLSFTPSSDSILFVYEAAEVDNLLADSNESSPPLVSLEPIDTSEPAAGVSASSAIKAVLRVCNGSQVTWVVVAPVAINVIYVFVARVVTVSQSKHNP
jgi:hypothetical protein